MISQYVPWKFFMPIWFHLRYYSISRFFLNSIENFKKQETQQSLIFPYTLDYIVLIFVSSYYFGSYILMIPKIDTSILLKCSSFRPIYVKSFSAWSYPLELLPLALKDVLFHSGGLFQQRQNTVLPVSFPTYPTACWALLLLPGLTWQPQCCACQVFLSLFLSLFFFFLNFTMTYTEFFLFILPGIWASWVSGLVPHQLWKILSKYHLWSIILSLHLLRLIKSRSNLLTFTYLFHISCHFSSILPTLFWCGQSAVL